MGDFLVSSMAWEQHFTAFYALPFYLLVLSFQSAAQARMSSISVAFELNSV